MARETKGRGSKKRITEIQEIKKLLTRMGSVKERNAELMVHVMFAVYAALWVSTCSQIIKKLEDENQLQYVLYNFYHHPRFYLGLGTFISLVCLWWWYTNVFLADNVFKVAGMSSWELLLLSVFALAYDSWGRGWELFGIIFFAEMLLLAFKFGLTIILMRRKNATKTPEFKPLAWGAGFTFLVLLGFFLAGIAAVTNSENGTFKVEVIQWALVGLVFACVGATLFSVFVLKLSQNDSTEN